MERLHFLDASNLVDDFIQRSAPPKVQRDQPAGQLRHPRRERPGFAERSKDLEGLALLVHRDGDVEGLPISVLSLVVVLGRLRGLTLVVVVMSFPLPPNSAGASGGTR